MFILHSFSFTFHLLKEIDTDYKIKYANIKLAIIIPFKVFSPNERDMRLFFFFIKASDTIRSTNDLLFNILYNDHNFLFFKLINVIRY